MVNVEDPVRYGGAACHFDKNIGRHALTIYPLERLPFVLLLHNLWEDNLIGSYYIPFGKTTISVLLHALWADNPIRSYYIPFGQTTLHTH